MKKVIMPLIVLLLGLVILSSPLKRIFTTDSETAAPPSSEQELMTKPQLIPVAKDEGYFDLALFDDGKAVAVGYDGHDPNRLYLSAGGYATWRPKSIPAEDSVMYAISIVAGNAWVVGGSGLVFFTSDEGDTWEKLSRPTHHELSGVSFINIKVGYAASRVERGCEIFRTTDGGRSWRKTYENLDAGYVFDLATLSEKVAIAAVNDGYVIRTEDGGTKWQAVESKLEGAASVTFTQDGTAWVVGRKGSLYLSTDRGRTWRRPPNLATDMLNQDWHSIAFADSKRGIAVGENGAMAVSYDAGVNWLEVKTGINERLREVRLNRDRVLILGSENIYKVELPPA